MDTLREQKAAFIPEPAEVLDFAKGIAGLQATNLLKYKMKNGSWIAIRPSGTEPKLKLYCSLVEKDEAAAKAKFAAVVSRFFRKFISSASKYRHQMYGFSSSAGCSISILNRCSMSI